MATASSTRPPCPQSSSSVISAEITQNEMASMEEAVESDKGNSLKSDNEVKELNNSGRERAHRHGFNHLGLRSKVLRKPPTYKGNDGESFWKVFVFSCAILVLLAYHCVVTWCATLLGNEGIFACVLNPWDEKCQDGSYSNGCSLAALWGFFLGIFGIGTFTSYFILTWISPKKDEKVTYHRVSKCALSTSICCTIPWIIVLMIASIICFSIGVQLSEEEAVSCYDVEEESNITTSCLDGRCLVPNNDLEIAEVPTAFKTLFYGCISFASLAAILIIWAVSQNVYRQCKEKEEKEGLYCDHRPHRSNNLVDDSTIELDFDELQRQYGESFGSERSYLPKFDGDSLVI